MAKSDTNPLTRLVHMYYIHPRLARHPPQTQRRNQKPREAHPTHPRTQRLSPSQRPSRRPAAQAKVAISSSPPGPVPPSLTTRRWKTPWTVLKSLLTEQPCPMERNGAARSRGPLGSPSASSNKTGLPPSPGSGTSSANWIPRTPARGTDPGLSPSCTRLRRTAQPTLHRSL